LLRIVSGEYKGRKLFAPKGSKTRPTLEKTRETVFDVLTSRYHLDEYEAIDLFAGSGAMGFEALSRGVCSAIFVELDRKICRLIKTNINRLGVEERSEVVDRDVLKWIPKFKWTDCPKVFFLDPPYKTELGQQAVDLLSNQLSYPAGCLLVIETHKNMQYRYAENFEVFRQKYIGNTRLDFVKFL